MDYLLVDADNHYYEAEDAFTRHGDEEVKAFVRWLSEGKKRHIMFGNVLATNIPNPTFNPITKPGIFYERLKELAERGDTVASTGVARSIRDPKMYGQLEPLPPYYLHRDPRLSVMDEQGVEKALFFPTLGVGIEGLNPDNFRMTYKTFHAFNRWLDEDWGFAHQGRIYAAPAIPVLDPVLATEELDFVLAKGARVVVLRPGPAGGRSPADPAWDPFWARLNESGAVAAYHGYMGADRYQDAFVNMWQRHGMSDPVYENNLATAINGYRPILETTVAMVLGNLFGRFPNLRIASIELGCAWVPICLHVLDHAGGVFDRHIEAFGVTVKDLPSDVFKEHVWVSPFPEEDAAALVELIGVDRVLFGSDWPHAEGTPQPAEYLSRLNKLDAASVRRVMRDNTLELLS